MLAQVSPETTLSLAAGAVLALWLFFFGACIGSFLNVVAYRLPLGKTLVTEPSKCPKCGAKIRPWHNVPVLGWLMLRGRCRDCQAPISPRYPLVEALAGGLLLALGWVELVGGGGNLPLTLERWPVGPAAFISALPWPLIAIFAYHAWLLYMLLTAALIRFDGHALPRSLVLLGVIVGLVPSFYGVLHPLPWQGPDGPAATAFAEAASLSPSTALQGLATAMAGLALGTLLGRPMSRWLAGERFKTYGDGAFLLMVVGLQLGWQTVALIAVLVLALAWILGMAPASQLRGRWSLSASGLAITLMVLLSWRAWSDLAFRSPLVPAALALGFLLLAPLAMARRWLAPRE